MQITINLIPLFIIIAIFCWNFVNSVSKTDMPKMLYHFFILILLVAMTVG